MKDMGARGKYSAGAREMTGYHVTTCLSELNMGSAICTLPSWGGRITTREKRVTNQALLAYVVTSEVYL